MITSLFPSLWRRREQPFPSVSLPVPLPPTDKVPLDQALDKMLRALAGQLPLPSPPLPAPEVFVVSMAEQPVGLGSRLGLETQGPFAVAELRGIWLDALVRFQLWGRSPVEVDTVINDLRRRLLSVAARETLRSSDILTLGAVGTSLAENVPAVNAWRETADYRVLFEFRYTDTDDAKSLIARIEIDPINIDSEASESTVVTDEMVRWDNLTAPALEVRGAANHNFRVDSLYILAFLPDGWDGNGMTVSASVGGTVREKSFPSVRAFRDAFTSEGGTIGLGGNPYRAGRMVFPNADFPDPIVLQGGDQLRIAYNQAAFDSDAVVYLKVLGG